MKKMFTLFIIFSLITFLGCDMSSDLPNETSTNEEEGTNGVDEGTNEEEVVVEDSIISISSVTGLGVPVAGSTPSTIITSNNQFSGIVTWSPTDETFKNSTQYTATITLTPKDGFTFQGITENFFSVNGADSVTNNANEGIITVLFPSTDDITIDISNITGVEVPVYGNTPSTSIIENEQFSGVVSWFPSDSTFEYSTQYTATVTLSSKEGFTFNGITENFFSVNGADSVTNNANEGIITVVFPSTEDAPPTMVKSIVGIGIYDHLDVFHYFRVFTYNDDGTLATIERRLWQNRLSSTEYYYYNELGQKSHHIHVSEGTTPDRRLNYFYDLEGKLIREEHPYDDNPDEIRYERNYYYDENDNLIEVVGYNHSNGDYVYTNHYYNDQNQLIRSTNVFLDGHKRFDELIYEYDVEGRISVRREFDENGVAEDYHEYVYDEDGDLERMNKFTVSGVYRGYEKIHYEELPFFLD